MRALLTTLLTLLLIALNCHIHPSSAKTMDLKLEISIQCNYSSIESNQRRKIRRFLKISCAIIWETKRKRKNPLYHERCSSSVELSSVKLQFFRGSLFKINSTFRITNEIHMSHDETKVIIIFKKFFNYVKIQNFNYIMIYLLFRKKKTFKSLL